MRSIKSGKNRININVSQTMKSVSYTHLDVYKRQVEAVKKIN